MEPEGQPEVKLRVFSGPFYVEHVHGLTHVHGFLGSQEYVGDFQSWNGYLAPQLFLLSLLVSLLFVPTVIYHLRQLWLQYLPVNVFDKWLQREAFSARWDLGQIKRSLWMGSSKELPERSNNYISFRIRLWKSSSSILPLVPRMWAVIFQGYHWARNETRIS